VTLAAGAFLLTLGSHAQNEDGPSLGDAARQARLQKQQKRIESAKDAQGKAAPAKDALSKDTPPKPADASKMKKVITNDEIPEHIGPTRTLPAKQTGAESTPPPNYDGKPPADYWKSQIQTKKNFLASLQNQIAELANSIQFAGGSCVSNCVQWNEQQLQKQEQLESMKAQLEQQQKSLEEFQDAARKQGFGSSVYDP
jgi:glucose/arabinose dehydrogenase